MTGRTLIGLVLVSVSGPAPLHRVVFEVPEADQQEPPTVTSSQ